MSSRVSVHRISRSSIEQLHFDLVDFDSITMQLPSGFYTTLRTYGGRTRVIGLREHLDRLYLPAKAREITVVFNQDRLREMLSEWLKPLAPHEARVRLILDASKKPGDIYVLLQKLKTLPREIYQTGVHLDISKTSREKPLLKQTNFISESSSERKHVGGEIFEILLTRNGRILEGLTSNFFYIREGVLQTAGRGVLAGVTRQTVIAIARRIDMRVHYKALALDDIPKIEEAFITSSSRGIMPVVQLEDQLIGTGQVGRLTKQLMNAYEQRVLEIAEPII